MNGVKAREVENLPPILFRSLPKYSSANPEFKAEFTKQMKVELVNDDFLMRFAGEVYAKVFTEAEVDQLIAFYESPAGAKLRDSQQTLNREMVPRLQVAYVPATRIADELVKEHPEWLNTAPVAGASASLTPLKAPTASAAPSAMPPDLNSALAAPVPIGPIVAQSNLVKKVDPEYPSLAKQARVQGQVEFKVTITKNGSVTNAQLVRGHPLLVDAARAAVLQWQYRPTLLNGEPVAVVTNVFVDFTLAP